MKKCAVIIPVYKVQPTQSEVASFRQCLKVLKEHPIILVTYRDMKLDVYNQLSHDVGKEVEIRYFDIEYFSDLSGYNELLISLNFYKTFRDNEYILIYQLDAWVFRDELEYWCDKGYDYIGAPWVEWCKDRETTILTGIGNGGFSLRKVSSALDIARRIKVIARWRKFWYSSRLQSIIRFESGVFEKIFKIHFNKDTINLFGCWQLQEDYYWAKYVSSTFPDFKVAPIEEGLKFSFEVNPSFLFKMNSEQLPFGCHAWERCDPEFWKEYIKL